MSRNSLPLPLPLLLLAAACTPGFQPHDDPKLPTQASGRALREGQPTSADVFVLDDSGQRLSAVRAGADGTFRFDLTRSGTVRIAFNDGQGAGRLLDAVLQPTGVNVLGDVELLPLDQAAGLLAVRGVGFEERLTSTSGDHRFTKYDRAVTRAYSAVEREASSYADIVEIDLSTGVETVLLSQVQEYSSWDPIPELVDDRLLIIEAILPCAADSNCPSGATLYLTRAAYDLLQRRIVYQVPFDHDAMHFSVVAGRLVALIATDRMPDGGRTLGGQPTYTYAYRLRAMDLLTGQWTVGANPSGSYTHHYAFHRLPNGKAIAWASNTCNIGQAPCFDDWLLPVELDLQALTSTSLGQLNVSNRQSGRVSPDGRYLFLVTDDAVRTPVAVSRYDLTTGALDELMRLSGQAPQFDISADGRSLALVEWAGQGYVSRSIDLASRTVTPVSMTQTYAGAPVALCAAYTGQICQVAAANGALRLVQYNRPSGRLPVWVLDGIGTSALALRKLNLGEMEEPMIGSALGFEVVGSRDVDSHLQLFSGNAGVDPSQLAVRLTWLPSDHDQLALTADARTAYHFAKDPLSGHVQLFQVATGN